MSLATFKGLRVVLVGILCGAPASLALAPVARATPPHCVGAGLRPASSDLRSVDAVTLCLVNGMRASRHLRPLRANPTLAQVAAGEVRQMVRLNYFADVSPTGQTAQSLIAASRYPRPTGSFTIGQNLAWGTGDRSTPASIVAAWMASPPHRAIILDPEFRDAGAAVTAAVPAMIDGTRDGATYAMEFGVRR